MVKVSVIIPVYNASNYLKESLNSILNQTLDDIEVICVDDDSQDNSYDILVDFASKNSNILVLNQKHNGGGAARNMALKHAKGKYIYFMDADDILDKKALDEFYHIAEEKSLDFLIFQAINYDDDTGEYFETAKYSMNKLYDFVEDNIFSFDDLGDYIFNVNMTPWCKFYNREFILKTGARFVEGLIFHDNIFHWQMFFDAKRIYFYKKSYYTRRRHSKSSTGACDERHINTIKINNLIIQEFINHGYFDKYKKKLYNKKLNTIFLRYSEIQDQFKSSFYDAMKKDFSKILNHEKYDEVMHCLNELNKDRFTSVIKANNFEEFELLLLNVDLRNENRKLKVKNRKLKKDVKKAKKLNKSIINSNSWKLTKPLRALKRWHDA